MDDFDSEMNDDLEDGVEGTLDGDAGSQADGSQSGSPSDGTSASDSDKRYNDLMSKWQKAEARAKKLEEAMKSSDGSTQAPKAGSTDVVDPKLKAWLEEAAADVADRAYRSDPRFEQYGISASEFRGESPEEIRNKVKQTRELIDKMETRIRNAILAEHGLAPEVISTRPSSNKSFAQMSSKEFNEYLKSQGF